MSSQAVASDIPHLTAIEFERFRQLAYDAFGLDLRAGKHTLLSARLGKKIRDLKLSSFEEYYRYVLADSTGRELAALADVLTTNHTSFFREPAHFDFLRETIAPALRQRDHVEIWSAGCSTGEEPYTIAFSLIEELGNAAFSKVRILATDISTGVLATARRGAYPSARFEGLPGHQLRRFLLRGENQWKGWYMVKREIRDMIEFRRLNLKNDFSHIGPFPVIFCRNVMIYFDRPTQQDLINRLCRCLEPGGYLLIGHAESLNAIDHPLRYVRPAIYKKPDARDAAMIRRRKNP
jgi:chemotaxis protein methyltransferase CheR